MPTQSFCFGDAHTEVIYSEHIPESFSAIIVDSILQWDPKGALRIPTGEQGKSLSVLETILSHLHKRNVKRKDVIAVAGGGSLSDVGAFAASIYLRGVGLVLIPTTLLAMVDASLGGKTGINFLGHKNMVGSFYPAQKVYICSSFLKSLTNREYRSGLAEVIKAAMIGDVELLSLLESEADRILDRDVALLDADIIPRAIAVKGCIVEKDFRENGIRAHLNLGHTFAHALEASSAFGYSHGEAVAWGLHAALVLGAALGISDADYVTRITRLLLRYGYQKSAKASLEDLLDAMQYDKKRVGNELRFVLQRREADTFVRSVSLALVKKVLKSLVY